MSRVGPSVLPAGCRCSVAKTLTLCITRKLFNYFFHACQAFRHHCLLPFYTAFSDLDLGCLSRGQREAKHLSFIFSHTFHLIRMKFDVMMKQCKHKYCSERFIETRRITAVLLTATETFNVGMHLDFNQSD